MFAFFNLIFFHTTQKRYIKLTCFYNLLFFKIEVNKIQHEHIIIKVSFIVFLVLFLILFVQITHYISVIEIFHLCKVTIRWFFVLKQNFTRFIANLEDKVINTTKNNSKLYVIFTHFSFDVIATWKI